MIVLFKVTWNCPDDGRVQQWFTTQIKACNFMAKQGPACTLEEVKVPKTRLALCEWLNTHFSTDNG